MSEIIRVDYKLPEKFKPVLVKGQNGWIQAKLTGLFWDEKTKKQRPVFKSSYRSYDYDRDGWDTIMVYSAEYWTELPPETVSLPGMAPPYLQEIKVSDANSFSYGNITDVTNEDT